jgi:hypothetical protein
MIDRFSKEQFEAALPKHKETQKPLWRGLGLQGGEYAYSIEVKPGVEVWVRSSVRANGQAALVAEDSIRAWLASPDGSSLGSKDQRWITRVNGWQTRMTDVLRKLYKRGLELGPCPTCGCKTTLAMKVVKEGPNKGRYFQMCSSKQCPHSWIKWMDAAGEPPKGGKKGQTK